MIDKFLSFAIDLLSRLPESSVKARLRNLFYQDVVSERLLEYPLIFRHLVPKSGRVLDVGCRYSNLVLQLSSLGYQVTGIDLEPYPYTHPNLQFVQSDVTKIPFRSNFFAVVTAVSTVEHIGLGFYEKGRSTPDLEADRKAIIEILRILKPRGQFLITVPFGKKNLTDSYRVYNQPQLKKLLTGFSRARYTYYYSQNGCWLPCPQFVAQRIDSTPIVKAFVLADCIK